MGEAKNRGTFEERKKIANPETDRINFLINRDGLQEAVNWSRRTYKIYRVAVLKNGKDGSKPHYASNNEYRRTFIESYLHLKRFVFSGVML